MIIKPGIYRECVVIPTGGSNGGKNNIIENNIFYNIKEDAIIFDNPGAWEWLEWFGMKGFMTCNRFNRNIIVRSAPADAPVMIVRDHPEDIPRVISESDYNVFHLSGSAFTASACPHAVIKVSPNAPPAGRISGSFL